MLSIRSPILTSLFLGGGGFNLQMFLNLTLFLTLNYLLLELLRQSNSLLFPEVVVLGTGICSTVLLHSYTPLTTNQLYSFNVVLSLKHKAVLASIIFHRKYVKFPTRKNEITIPALQTSMHFQRRVVSLPEYMRHLTDTE